jgi:hypothetical protein
LAKLRAEWEQQHRGVPPVSSSGCGEESENDPTMVAIIWGCLPEEIRTDRQAEALATIIAECKKAKVSVEALSLFWTSEVERWRESKARHDRECRDRECAEVSRL